LKEVNHSTNIIHNKLKFQQGQWYKIDFGRHLIVLLPLEFVKIENISLIFYSSHRKLN